LVQMVTPPGIACPQCGTARAPQARFCALCGTPFPPPPAVVAQPAWTARSADVASAFGGHNARLFAGFWRRALALLFDSILVIILLLPVHFLARWIFDEALSRTVLDPAGRTFDRMTTVFILLDQTVKSGIGLAYFVLFERFGQQRTIGKMMTGCRVAHKTGGRIGILRVLGRNLLKPVSALPCLLGFLIAAFMPQKQALHDLLAGTRVVKGGR